MSVALEAAGEHIAAGACDSIPAGREGYVVLKDIVPCKGVVYVLKFICRGDGSVLLPFSGEIAGIVYFGHEVEFVRSKLERIRHACAGRIRQGYLMRSLVGAAVYIIVCALCPAAPIVYSVDDV